VIRQAIQQHAAINAAYAFEGAAGRAALKADPKASFEQSRKPLGQSISYRFLRDEKGWRVFITTAVPKVKKVSIKALGRIGIDINADCLTMTETDTSGNLVAIKTIQLVTYGKSSDQAEAIIGDAVKVAVDQATKTCKPLVIEKLKFSKKRAELEGENHKYARMLSSFSYNKIVQGIKSRAYRFGIEVIEVNPAYTSVIGLVNYSKRFGISVHQAASFAIARRGNGFRECPAQEREATVPLSDGNHVTFPLPVRNQGKHVWSFWSDTKKIYTAVLAAHFRPLEHGDPSKTMKPKTSKRKCPNFTVRPRNANRQQHCLAGVMDDVIPW
jgi:IS605 OrfB family transposase